MALRSPVGDLGTKSFVYQKISSMGNGYTFVVESAIFAALTYAAVRVDGGKTDSTCFSVFGDDIVVRQEHFESVICALYLAGFKANPDKTFSIGPFRESCGTDWFDGKPIRPIFLKEAPTDVSGLYLNFNRFKRILELRFGVEESQSVKLHRKWIPGDLQYQGPYSDEDFDSYLHSSQPPLGSWGLSRYGFKRLVRQPRRVPGATDFLFRKLMHNLKPVQGGMDQWLLKKSYKIQSLGRKASRFTVVKRNFLTVSNSYSASDIWRSTYTEYTPAPL
jgi:hypothetical protein